MESDMPFKLQFPLDILHQIFEIALDDTDDLRAFDDQLHLIASYLYHPPNHPRLTIPLICRQWKTHSKPYLWRTLKLRTISRVIRVCERLEEDPTILPLVHRLVVNFLGQSEGVSLDELSARLLNLCRSVRVLNYVTLSRNDSLPEALANLSSLKALAIKVLKPGDYDIWMAPLLQTVRQLAPRLTSLQVQLHLPEFQKVPLHWDSLPVRHLRLCVMRNSGIADPKHVLDAYRNPSIHRLEVSGSHYEMVVRLREAVDGTQNHPQDCRAIWYSLEDDEWLSLGRIANQPGGDVIFSHKWLTV